MAKKQTITFDNDKQRRAVMALLRESGMLPKQKRSRRKRGRRVIRRVNRGAKNWVGNRFSRVGEYLSDHIDQAIAAVIITQATILASRGLHKGRDAWKTNTTMPGDPTRNRKGQFVSRKG